MPGSIEEKVKMACPAGEEASWSDDGVAVDVSC